MSVTPDETQDEASKEASGGIVGSILKSRFARINGMSARGLEASSIGIVMAGCIGLGYLAGHWLDNRFGTTYWTPVMLLIGIGAGFREFFHIIKSLNKQAMREQAERAGKRRQNSGTGDFSKPKGAPLPPESAPDQTNSEDRSRSFRIPAPPVASFEKTPVTASPETVTKNTPDDVDDISNLTERLLKENDDRPSSL